MTIRRFTNQNIVEGESALKVNYYRPSTSNMTAVGTEGESWLQSDTGVLLRRTAAGAWEVDISDLPTVRYTFERTDDVVVENSTYNTIINVGDKNRYIKITKNSIGEILSYETSSNPIS